MKFSYKKNKNQVKLIQIKTLSWFKINMMRMNQKKYLKNSYNNKKKEISKCSHKIYNKNKKNSRTKIFYKIKFLNNFINQIFRTYILMKRINNYTKINKYLLKIYIKIKEVSKFSIKLIYKKINLDLIIINNCHSNSSRSRYNNKDLLNQNKNHH